jgi:hypothetical protein
MEGYAVSYHQYDDRYLNDQRDAEENFAGIWEGEFVAPYDYRREEREIDDYGYDEPDDYLEELPYSYEEDHIYEPHYSRGDC